MPIPKGGVIAVRTVSRVRAVIVIYIALGKVKLWMRSMGSIRALEVIIGIDIEVVEFVIVGDNVARRPPIQHCPHMAALKDVILDQRTRCLATQIYVRIPRTGNMQESV